MPLFPIAAEATANERSSCEDSLRIAASAPASSARIEAAWAQVGRSYSQSLPSKEDAVHPPAPGATGESQSLPGNAARRCKAVDFFGDAEGSTPIDPPSTHIRPKHTRAEATTKRSADQRGRHAYEAERSGKRKKRSSSPSDNGSDSSPDNIRRHRKTGRQRSAKDRERRKKNSSSRKSKGKHHHRRSSRRHRSGSRSASDDSKSEGSSDQDEPKSRRRLKSADASGQPLFVEDRKGDPDNVSFGGFYRLDVPIYYGMNDAARRGWMRRSGGSGKALRYFGSQARNANGDGRLARLQLWKGKKRRDQAMARASAGLPRDSSMEEGSTPLTVEGNLPKATPDQTPRPSADFLPVDPMTAVSPDARTSQGDPTGKQDSGVHMESLEQWVTRRTKEFNVMTRKQPHSEGIWLQFADFQEEAVRANHGGGLSLQAPSEAVARMALEKRASVLEGALRRNPSSIKLRTALLHLADQLQEPDVVDALWNRAIEKSDQSLTLWLRYLQFKARHFAPFTVPNQRSTYARCIRALESKREETRKSLEEEQRAKGVFIMAGRSLLHNCAEHGRAEKNLLEVLWSYCMMERAAGYHERALGALQAMVELNIRSSGSTASMEELEDFWDSEAPRIGDAHPSLAGISRWRDTSASARVEPSGTVLESGRLKSVAARRPPISRPPGIRGKRKRAVDFFTGASSTATNPTVAGTGRPGIAEKASDVLEKAYYAAMALSSVRTSPAESMKVVSEDAPPNASTLSCTASRDEGREPTRISLDYAVQSGTALQETISTSGSPNKTADPEEAKSAGRAPKNDEHVAVTDKADRAVDAEGLIWLDESQTTAYSVRHGYRIDVQGAQDSVSGLEYGRILSQMRGGDAAEGRTDRDIEAAAAASERQRSRGARKREAETAKQAAELEDVPEADAFAAWAKGEDRLTGQQWQPLRATDDAEGAEEQPDRVIFVEDLRPFLFSLSQPASSRFLVGMLLSVGGLVFPRSNVSHAATFMSEASCAGSFGDGGLSGSLIAAVDNGLQAVWRASEADLPVSGKGVVRCTGRAAFCLPPLAVSTAADQFLLITDEVVLDLPRQTFLRNVLHHLIRAPGSLPKPGASSGVSVWGAHGGDMLVQLQCTLVMFEGYLASSRRGRTGSSDNGGAADPTEPAPRSGGMWSEDDTHGHEARKVAKSLLEASDASATDLRLWSSYVQLLALLDSRQEAIKVAEKALSMVQALPEDKKPLSAELFWLAFRLHAGLPLNPRDAHAGEDSPHGATDAISDIFRRDDNCDRNRSMALLVLCSFAEGGYRRPKTKKSKRQGKDSSPDERITPPRLMAARRLMADHVRRIAAGLPREGAEEGVSSRLEGALDMTPSLMYYSVAWAWLEYLTRGPDEAEKAMATCLSMARGATTETIGGATTGVSADGVDNIRLGGTLAGNKPYDWGVVAESNALGVCLERMHRAFAELVVLAQRYDPAVTGPRRVRAVLLRGLQSFPAEPGMLCMLLDAEQFSSSQQRLVHHLFEVSRRRALAWEQGPTPLEWILSATHQVRRCVHEARQVASLPGARSDSDQPASRGQDHDRALQVKNWLPGSYSRLRRSMEAAVTHSTGRGIPLLWRMYMSLEAMRGNNTQAKHLFWRAIHACPGNKAVWMDALRGDRKERMGAAGLRPAFRAKELHEILDAVLEKSVHLRIEPP